MNSHRHTTTGVREGASTIPKIEPLQGSQSGRQPYSYFVKTSSTSYLGLCSGSLSFMVLFTINIVLIIKISKLFYQEVAK